MFTLTPSEGHVPSLASPEHDFNFGRLIAFSPDGRRLIAGGWAGESGHARIWDVGLRQVRRELPVSPSRVLAVAWSPNGRVVATGSKDGTVAIWDADNGTSLQCATEKDASEPGEKLILSLEFSPDGDQLLAACFDAKARIWDVATGTVLRSLEGHEYLIYQAVFSPDGRRVATASYDYTVRLWDVASGQELLSFQRGADAMTAVTFSPDGQCLTAGLEHYPGTHSTLFQWSCAEK